MKTIIGVMGGGSATPETMETARELGRLIAGEGWVLLCGGRAAGVMEAVARGAKEGHGLTLGILPGEDASRASAYIDLPVPTGMGSARNLINILASRVVVACPGGMGTLSEVALAIKFGRPLVLLGFDPGKKVLAMAKKGLVVTAKTPGEAVERVREFLAGPRGSYRS